MLMVIALCLLYLNLVGYHYALVLQYFFLKEIMYKWDKFYANFFSKCFILRLHRTICFAGLQSLDNPLYIALVRNTIYLSSHDDHDTC